MAHIGQQQFKEREVERDGDTAQVVRVEASV
jgi:hypothetical protein